MINPALLPLLLLFDLVAKAFSAADFSLSGCVAKKATSWGLIVPLLLSFSFLSSSDSLADFGHDYINRLWLSHTSKLLCRLPEDIDMGSDLMVWIHPVAVEFTER
jgi:hypothetical protein